MKLLLTYFEQLNQHPMKKSIPALLLALFVLTASAQVITLPPSGGNQKSSVTQWIGLAAVTINYSSPDIHGPSGEDRKGHIWGELVHYGFIDQGYASSKAAPWRAGANENTTISFTHDVLVNGQKIKAGTYGLFLDVEKDSPWKWIFSNNATSWGSYYYNPKEDALRVDTQPQEAPYTEWLTFGFDDRLPQSAVAYLQWENKRVPMKIEVPDGMELYLAKIRSELNGTTTGFRYQGYMEAAQFCAQNKINLVEALQWADSAISQPFFGRENFSTLQAKAQVLMAMNKTAEADAVMDKAVNILPPPCWIFTNTEEPCSMVAKLKKRWKFLSSIRKFIRRKSSPPTLDWQGDTPLSETKRMQSKTGKSPSGTFRPISREIVRTMKRN
jgi:hypothetical protein